MIRAVIFDWDFTLARTLRFRAKLLRHFCRLANIPFWPLARRLRELYGMTAAQIMEFAPRSILRSEIRRTYRSEFRKHARMMAFVGKKTLLRLQAARIKTGIVTNDLAENIIWYLKQQGITVPVVLDTNESPKPDPVILKQMLKKLRVKPSEAVYVGDHPLDIRFGKNAGVRTIAVPTWLHPRWRLKKEKPDAICGLRDVPDIVRRW